MSGRLIGIARHEKPHAPIEELKTAAVSLERGIEGDGRGSKPDHQVTVVFREDWEAACRDHGRDLRWVTRRANLYVEGVTGFKRIGARIKVGAVLLEVCEETEPCSRMDAQSQGLRAALQPDWRGGVNCKVLTAGEIALGDRVEVVEGQVVEGRGRLNA
jgi:MOSC domain-containing protein YiiM